MGKKILAHTDCVSQTLKALSNDEICRAIEEINNFRITGIMNGDAFTRKIAMKIHEQYKVPNDIRLVNDVILYEAARRFYNWRNADFY